MRWRENIRTCGLRGLGMLSLSVALAWTSFGSADRFPADSVEELRQFLKALPEELLGKDPALAKKAEALKFDERQKLLSGYYDQELNKRIAALRNLGEMRRALQLGDWKLEEGRDDFTSSQQKNRAKLIDRFRGQLKDTFQKGSENAKIAVINLITDMGPTVKYADSRFGLAGSATPELVKLIESQTSPSVRQAAAKCLGSIYPEPKEAGATLGKLLASTDPQDRRAAAAALANMAKVVTQLISQTSTATGVIARRDDLASTGAAVLSTSARGLKDNDVVTRRLSAEAMNLAAGLLTNNVPQRSSQELFDTETDRVFNEATRKDLKPLIDAVASAAEPLAAALGDADEEVQVTVRRAIEEIGSSRQRLVKISPANADVLYEPLRKTVPPLAAGLGGASIRVRLAGAEALEAATNAATGAGPQLIRTLQDKNRFVRWVAVRSLGKLGANKDFDAVPELARLLQDSDLDLRLASATALERIGPSAKEAVPALVTALGATDAEMRVAAIRSLTGIGTDAKTATGEIAKALKDADPRVRTIAAQSLGKFGPLAANAEDALRQAMDDSSLDVRKAASDALLNVVVQPK